VQSGSVTPLVPTGFVVGAPSVLTFPAGTWVHVLLHRPDTGAVIATQPVTVAVRAHGTTAWSTRIMTTDSTGRIAWWQRPSRSVDLRVSYAGPFGWASAASRRTITVRSAISAVLSRTQVRVGHSVALHGYIRPGAGGVRVWRERYYAGSWHVVAWTTTSEEGFYRFVVTAVTRGTKVMRTVVAPYGGRARGVSPVVRLHVLA